MADLKKYAVTAAIALVAVAVVNNFAPMMVKAKLNGIK
jgi:hypothetical protein